MADRFQDLRATWKKLSNLSTVFYLNCMKQGAEEAYKIGVTLG